MQNQVVFEFRQDQIITSKLYQLLNIFLRILNLINVKIKEYTCIYLNLLV